MKYIFLATKYLFNLINIGLNNLVNVLLLFILYSDILYNFKFIFHCLSRRQCCVIKYLQFRGKNRIIIQNIYFVTKTGQFEYVTTPEAVLPNSSFLNPDLPLVPITIKSILSG